MCVFSRDSAGGWYSYKGEATYAIASQQKPGFPYRQYIPYGFSVYNAVTQNRNLVASPLFYYQWHQAAFNVRHQWSDTVQLTTIDYDANARIFRDGAYTSYDWANDRVNAPVLADSRSMWSIQYFLQGYRLLLWKKSMGDPHIGPYRRNQYAENNIKVRF